MKADTTGGRPAAQPAPIIQNTSKNISGVEDVESNRPKKVQKEQINTLGKMLSALRR
jgi:hypothetical protein